MSKFNFTNVSRQAVPSNRTASFVFYNLEGQPSLEVRPATEENPAYMRAILKGSKEQVRRLRSSDMTPEMLEENRRKDRRLFPRYIIVGWTNVLDADGNPVPFSEEACAEFVQALPRDMFNEIRDFASTIANFRPSTDDDGNDDGPLDEVEVEDIVGN